MRLKTFRRFCLFPPLWEIWEFLRCFISKGKLKIFGIWYHDTGKCLNTSLYQSQAQGEITNLFLKIFWILITKAIFLSTYRVLRVFLTYFIETVFGLWVYENWKFFTFLTVKESRPSSFTQKQWCVTYQKITSWNNQIDKLDALVLFNFRSFVIKDGLFRSTSQVLKYRLNSYVSRNEAYACKTTALSYCLLVIVSRKD